MKRLFPWGLGWRNVLRHLRVSVFLVLTTALLVAVPFAVGTVAATATFSTEEVASTAMGQADVRARTTSYQTGIREDAPVPGVSGITGVIEDRDLQLRLEGPSGEERVTGRWLPFRAPLAEGILTFTQSRPGSPELALSSSAMEKLGTQIGDKITIVGRGISLTVTDLVEYAPDTATPLAVVDPAALSPQEQRALLADSGSARWLLSTDDLNATLEGLDSLGLVAETRASLPPAPGASLISPVVVVTAAGIIGVAVLAGTGAARAGSRRRVVMTLTRLGVRPREAHAVTRIESCMVTLAGVVLAAPLGIGLSMVGRSLGESVTSQLWGPLEPEWLAYAIAGTVALIIAPLLAVSGSREPTRRWRPRKVRALRRVDAGLIGRRLSWQRVHGTVFGTVSVALIVGVAGAGILGGLFVAESTRLFYEPDVPGDMVALGFGRQLTDTEVRALSAGAGSAVIEDRRVEFNGSLVVVDSPVTQCKSDPTNTLSHCVETVGYMEDFVVMVEPSSAAGFLGRELTPEETAAIETGDGLLLSEPRDNLQLVYSASIQSKNAQDGGPTYTQSINPVPVSGYSGYERIPGLLIGPDALERWGLDVDTDPISYYLLTPYGARPTEEAVREALPRDVVATADVIMNREEEMNDANSAVQQTIVAVAAGLVFLVVTLLVLAWVAGSTETLRRLSRMGAPTRTLLAVVLVRSVRALLPAAIVGVGVAASLTWAFSEYVGVSIPIVGWMWLVPGLTAILAVPVGAVLRVGLARDLKG